jgi:anti-sigma regulatory factor (Ser/Thr protein kinase)
MSDKETIRRRALALIAGNGSGTATRLAAEFGLSRQVANGYLQGLVRDGLIEATGTTRGRTYRLRTLEEAERTYPRDGLDEDRVWRELIKPAMSELPDNVRNVWHYGATEMINNAIDHSGSPSVRVQVRRNAFETEVTVVDEGEGIFLKIQRALALSDPRESILELAKGKLTTAPAHHTGEGIFFTSRVMDLFEIESHHLRFSHQPRTDDRIVEHTADTPGTRVRMRLANDSPRTMLEVFSQFTDGSDDPTFDRTVVPLRLAQHEGDRLVSRSQAKRVANRFERFKRVELDFSGIEEIGQAFADELFRVYAREHPDIRITPVNTVPAVAQMIRRAVSTPTEGVT